MIFNEQYYLDLRFPYLANPCLIRVEKVFHIRVFRKWTVRQACQDCLAPVSLSERPAIFIIVINNFDFEN